MAPRQNQGGSNGNNSAARDIVSDSLGLDLNDLGVGDDDNDLDDDNDGIEDSSELDGDRREFVEPDDDDGIGDALDQGRRQQRQQPDRVTHTRGDRRPFKKGAEVKPDDKGNLVDPATGQIVARAGREANLYQRAFKAGEGKKVGGLEYQLRQANDKVVRAVNLGRQLQSQLTTFKAQADAVKQFNLEPEDTLRAFKLFSDLNSNPTETLKYLLTRAAANGIKLDTIVQGGVTFDPKSVTDMIKAELGKVTAPLVERNKNDTEAAERQRQLDEQNNRIAADTQDFFDRNEDARPYMPVFVRLMESSPEYAKMSPSEIWTRIQLHEERRKNTPRARQNGSRMQGSRPQGRSHPAAGNSEMAPVNQEYSSILNEVLDQHGIRR